MVFFQRYKSILSEGLVHHPKGTIFSLRDLRNTCCNLILRFGFHWRNIEKIARIHLRQSLGYSYPSLKVRMLTKPITKTEYYDAVLDALGFPWDEKEIKSWHTGR